MTSFGASMLQRLSLLDEDGTGSSGSQLQPLSRMNMRGLGRAAQKRVLQSVQAAKKELPPKKIMYRFRNLGGGGMSYTGEEILRKQLTHLHEKEKQATMERHAAHVRYPVSSRLLSMFHLFSIFCASRLILSRPLISRLTSLTSSSLRKKAGAERTKLTALFKEEEKRANALHSKLDDMRTAMWKAQRESGEAVKAMENATKILATEKAKNGDLRKDMASLEAAHKQLKGKYHAEKARANALEYELKDTKEELAQCRVPTYLPDHPPIYLHT